MMKCERQQTSSCHGRVDNVIQITAKTTYTKSTMVLEGHQSTNTHMKMLFRVCCLNKQGYFYKVILLVIISAYLFFSWIGKHNVILKFLVLLALSTHWLTPFSLPKKMKEKKNTRKNKAKPQNYVNPNNSLGERTAEMGTSEHHYFSVVKSSREYFASVRWV